MGGKHLHTCARAATGLVTVALAACLAVGTAAAESRAEVGAWASVFELSRPLPHGAADRVVVVLKEPGLAEWSASADRRLTPAQQTAFVRAALAEQQRLISELQAQGVSLRVVHRFVRTLNGFSAQLAPGAARKLRAHDAVESVTPARILYPMATAAPEVPAPSVDKSGDKGVDTALSGAALGAAGMPAQAAGTTIAVLDAAIDFNQPALQTRQAGPGYDAIRGLVGVEAPASESHGTQVALAALAGAADDQVRIESYRVLEQQPVIGGAEALLGRSDSLLAALERAVDPNVDGSSADAVAVALVASGTPYASFAEAPEQIAVSGALELGTVVVAAAGNDGHSPDIVGTVGVPAAAAEAIAVGAADLRRQTPAVDVQVRGQLLDTVLKDVPLLTSGPRVPRGELQVVAVEGTGADVVDYLDSQVRSRVQGQVALLRQEPGVRVTEQIRAAADAGAVAVVFAGSALGATAGVVAESGVDIPALGISLADASAITAAAKADGARISLSSVAGRNTAYGSVANFSSAGATLAGPVRPDLVESGVGERITTQQSDGVGNGTSFAAARVAGIVASVRAARPGWSARQVRTAVIGSADPLANTRVELQGAGVPTAAGAQAVTVVAAPARIDFGRASVATKAFATLAFENARSGVPVAFPSLLAHADGSKGVSVARNGNGLEASVAADAAPGVHGGWLQTTDGALRVPWTIVVTPAGAGTVPTAISVSRTELKPSADSSRPGAEVIVSIGGQSVVPTGLGIRGARRVDVLLYSASGGRLGLLETVEHALPGVYRLALTGYGIDAKPLAPGRYQLRLAVTSALAPAGAAAAPGPSVDFTVTG